MRNKGLFIVAIIMTVLLGWAGAAAGITLNTQVKITGRSDNTVDISVYFNDSEGVFNNIQYASDMAAGRGEPNWIKRLQVKGSSPDKYVVISNAERYMNYYVRIAGTNGMQAADVKIFTGPDAGNGKVSEKFHGNTGPAALDCNYCHNGREDFKIQLENKADQYQLCMLCHSNANIQSKYDVELGLVAVSGKKTRPSLGGPFAGQTGTGTISLHDPGIQSGTISVNLPGNYVLDRVVKSGLACTTCHDGHGGGNGNYRFLKQKIHFNSASVMMKGDIVFDAYAVTKDGGSGEELFMVRGSTEFCAACHMDYIKKVRSYRPRHPVSMGNKVFSIGSHPDAFNLTAGETLPLQYDQLAPAAGATEKRTAVVCLTCHYAHGSTKGFNVMDTVYYGQFMLRQSGYDMCTTCHKR